MNATNRNIINLDQGCVEWKSLRKTKICSSDASVIMGVNPYKTLLQLYLEKTSDYEQHVTAAMRRGTELEPIARELLTVTTKIDFIPAVYVKGWQMASLDGISQDGNMICEIKCPGEKTHSIARKGLIPDIYYPQIQHQMHVCDAEKCMYVSFDGIEIFIVECERNEEYIAEMVKKEHEFYQMLLNKTPPEEYVNMTDNLWLMYAQNLISLSKTISGLEEQQKIYKDALIALAKDSNCQGGGVKLKKIKRKGNIDYESIPELKGVDLNKYRKEQTESWRFEYEKDRANLSSHNNNERANTDTW